MNFSVYRIMHNKHVQLLPQSEEVDIFVTDALRYVIQNVFSNLAKLFTITISTAATPAELWLQGIMGRLFVTWGFMAIQFIMQDSKHEYIEVAGRRYCNMILVDSYESLKNTRLAEHNQHFDTLEYYFIFLQTPDDRMPKHREKILKYCFDNYWLHCNVMIQNARGQVLIYTYFPFQAHGCFRTEPVLINQFNGESFVNEVMFPDKLRDLHGCPLKLTVWDVPPFIEYPRNGSVNDLSGLEMILLQALSELLNFTFQLDKAAGIDIKRPNNTSSGKMLRMSNIGPQLISRQTNITAGYLRRTPKRDETSTPSAVLYNLPVRLVVLRRHNQHEYMTVLLFPFDRCTWLLLIISLLLMICLNSIGRNGDPPHSNWLVVLEALLGVTTSRVPKYLTLRRTFIVWVIATFYIRSLYQARLFYLFGTNFYKAPPDTLAALIEGNYRAVCTNNSVEFLKYVPEIANASVPLIALNTTDELEPLRYLEKYPEENLVATTVNDFILYYVPRELKPHNAFILITPVVNEQRASFYFPKHSYLVERFNEVIMRFHQAGLIDRWREKSIASRHIGMTIGSAVRSYEGSLMIDMKQFSGFMIIIHILHVFALIVFALEVASKYQKSLEKCFRG